MRRHILLLLLVDVALMGLATFAAQLLRDNMTVVEKDVINHASYLIISMIVSLFVFAAFGLHRSIWRYSSIGDYLSIATAVLTAVLISVLVGFAFNRLETVARSLPLLQGVLAIFLMVSVRVLSRMRHLSRGASALPTEQLGRSADDSEVVLVLGINRVAALFLQSVDEFARNRITIAGLLGKDGQSHKHVGRRIHKYEVLGRVENVSEVLNDLAVRGIFVDRIVIAVPYQSLSPEGKEALTRVQRSSDVRIDMFADRIFLNVFATGTPDDDATSSSYGDRDGQPTPAEQRQKEIDDEHARVLEGYTPDDLTRMANRPYLILKRGIDIVGAATLLILTAPILFAAALLVARELGLPVVFWQQRPGMFRRPFKVYKLRTMAEAYDSLGHRISDENRQRPIGRFLRRTRLDELPQLINILRGDMSFVGPRPLLAVDHCGNVTLRQIVKPGLTGWAQVMGGRAISASDKAALDAWYIHNMSLMLDIEIVLRTIPMVLRGEQLNTTAVANAWRYLDTVATKHTATVQK